MNDTDSCAFRLSYQRISCLHSNIRAANDINNNHYHKIINRSVYSMGKKQLGLKLHFDCIVVFDAVVVCLLFVVCPSVCRHRRL